MPAFQYSKSPGSSPDYFLGWGKVNEATGGSPACGVGREAALLLANEPRPHGTQHHLGLKESLFKVPMGHATPPRPSFRGIGRGSLVPRLCVLLH
jgi:hypothetical protein